ncbi:MAG: hypothetical protein ACI9VM_000824 [Candidatus Azotimanducaceae bacterium]|jgi:hypothetical protein
MITLQKIRPILFAFLFMGTAASGLGWIWFSIESYGTDLRDRLQTIANEQAFSAQYDDLLAVTQKTETERMILNQFVLRDESDTITLLSRLDEIEMEQGVDLETQELSVSEGLGSFDNLEVSFKLSGNGREVNNMIRIFETLPYHGYITSLSIHRIFDETTGGREIDARILLLVSVKKHD